MARQVIDTTTNNGAYIGDPANVAFGKVNDNFLELYTWIAAVPAFGKNYLINPRMNINQRAFAGGALAANTYGYDRFKAGAAGCNISVNQATGLITHTSGSLVQVVEDPRLAGATVCFSVENPSAAIAVTVAGVSGTITAGTGRRGVAIAIPSGSTGNINVIWSVSAPTTYARPQLEDGSAPSTFEPRPIALELALCQRYYENSFPPGTAPGTGAAGVGVIASGLSSGTCRTQLRNFAVPKRAPPSLTFYTDSTAASQAVGRWSLYNGATWAAGNVSPSNLSVYGFCASLDFGSGLTFGQSYLCNGNYQADAEL